MRRVPANDIRIAAFMLALAAFAAQADPTAEAAPSIEVAAFGVAPALEPSGTVPDVSPFFAATDAVGLPEALALQVTELFAEEVDFHRDLDGGYQCTLVFEMHHVEGLPRPGRILAAEFAVRGKRLEAFLFDDGRSGPGYFDAEGLDVNRTLHAIDPVREPWAVRLTPSQMPRAFRRSPLAFDRITSLPSNRRFHPILKEWRAHRGTDYAAPIGTPVRATADGEIAFVGARGSYGRLVELRHFERYTTRYGHLHRIEPGLDAGQEVRKGQVIGQVGMTGLTTGPHLHYELLADPGAVAPTRLRLAVRTVPPWQREPLRQQVAEYRKKLGFARSVNLVWLE